MPDSKDALQLLGGLTSEQFLKEYWQKKPLLIRNAIPDFESPVDPQDLAGLSLEHDIESRIIIENGNNGPWELKTGPFTETDFEQLPETHWTLLIQQLDAWSPEINELKKLFQFIPNWRIDDIMASYAPLGGSVGPHFDYYDVFLLQASGERHWRIGQRCDENSLLLENTPLSILESFDETESWILKPGDMLYLPPKIAHFGVAQNDCITLSVGFRAPSHAQILSHFTDYLLEHTPSSQFYSDENLTVQDHCGEIHPSAIDKLRQIIDSASSKESLLTNWFGEFITAPKNENTLQNEDADRQEEDIIDLVAAGQMFYVNEGSRMAYFQEQSQILFFADGATFALALSNLKIVQTLCETGHLPANLLENYTECREIITLVVDLMNAGSLYCDEHT